MGEGKRGKPRSELERLEIFERLAADYFRMVELFTADGGPVPAGSVDGERRHWLELFRAALLRKFIVRDEHVSLKLVVRALRACNHAADRRLAEGADEIAGLFTAEMVQGRQHGDPGPAAADGREIFEDVLYGRLLHGDADRFHRSEWAKDHDRVSAVAATRFEAEHALRKALDVVRFGFANDLLRSPAAPIPVGLTGESTRAAPDDDPE
ncbi:hypothetical protein J2X01_000858 [Arthrobacter ginsengisoli]|uniref:Uncharacterized protein n=1 Tax=Arthrobacter ginsengisoli TaxID=1356565 RepID=A0ABU1U8W0_9MICC|nr:hypothetical protein [Arthrobacter ginsengisoli]MDR7081581.1 hypothetical protein [Arthrobacter ginsengisoli]